MVISLCIYAFSIRNSKTRYHKLQNGGRLRDGHRMNPYKKSLLSNEYHDSESDDEDICYEKQWHLEDIKRWQDSVGFLDGC